MTNGTATLSRNTNQSGPDAEIERRANRLAATGAITAAAVHDLVTGVPRRHRSRLLAALIAAETVGLVAGAQREARERGAANSAYLAQLGVATG